MKVFLPLIAAGLLTACMTPYPGGTPYPGARLSGASVSGNPHPRGSEAFCRNYARQTASNQYEGNRDSGDGFGSDMFAAQQARDAGALAYDRCRAGRTG